MSTLNFAKRAKMIRNKAVVNEDTTGTVLLLQQEIKRLKSELIDIRSRKPPAGAAKSPLSSTMPLPNQETKEGAVSGTDLEQALRSTIELRQGDVKMYEELLKQKDQTLSLLKKSVRRCKHERESDLMMLKFKEAAIDKLRSGKGLEPGEEVAALRDENRALHETADHDLAAAIKLADQTDLNEQIKLKFGEQNEYIQQMNDILKKLGEEKSEMKKRLDELESSKGVAKAVSSEVENTIAKVKLEYGEKIEELSQKYLE